MKSDIKLLFESTVFIPERRPRIKRIFFIYIDLYFLTTYNTIITERKKEEYINVLQKLRQRDTR